VCIYIFVTDQVIIKGTGSQKYKIDISYHISEMYFPFQYNLYEVKVPLISISHIN